MTEQSSSAHSSLWGLVVGLFVILLLFFFHAVFSETCSLCSRFCTIRRYACFCCCCTLDMQGYRRERESLLRLRELHRIQLFRHQLALQTFSQIPGPVPNSLDLSPSTTASLLRAYQALGFIIVPSTPTRQIVDLTSPQFRDQLTMEQRRTILEQLVVCHEYHDDKVLHRGITGGGSPDDCGDEIAVVETNESDPESIVVSTEPQPTIVHIHSLTTNPGSTVQPSVLFPSVETVDEEVERSTSFIFPFHEEPDEAACAICLDPFLEGEAITSQSRCTHVFHKNCLLSWLDQHDVCPCCRQLMIGETEWRQAALSSGISSQTMIQFGTPVLPASMMTNTQIFQRANELLRSADSRV